MTMRTIRVASLVIFALGLLCQRTQAVDDIYKNGTFNVKAFSLSMAQESLGAPGSACKKGSGSPSAVTNEGPPRPLYIAVPQQSGEYPVIHLQHGYHLINTFYSQLMYHVASHGFIVIAPQMKSTLSLNATDEIADGAAVLDWYPNNLEAALLKQYSTLHIVPNLTSLVLAGHSRGGKVAFGLATGVCKSSLNFSAIVGFDPVDGIIAGRSSPPKILTNVSDSLNLTFPTLILGAAFGSDKDYDHIVPLPPCAPQGISHDEFYNESGPELSLHFVAKCYGHMDYLNDDLGSGFEAIIGDSTCKNGCPREPMRKRMRTFAGGIFIAFLEAVLLQNDTALAHAFENPSQAYASPIYPPQMKPAKEAHLASNFSGGWEIPYADICKRCDPVVSF